MRMFNWVGYIFAAGLGGCSVYPIPDDVSPFSTQEIVRHARCEMRDALLIYLADKGTIPPREFTPQEMKAWIKAASDREKTNKPPKDDADVKLIELARLAKVAAVYAFDFNITEKNNTGATAAFKLPWISGNVLDAGASAGLDLTRNGQRVFTSQDTWGDLLIDNTNPIPRRCPVPWPQSPAPENFIYPLTGSIGVGRVVKTFIDIDEQGGAKDSFVDTLTFTTLASGGATAGLTLQPVTNQFRLVAATAAAGASRQDIHKLTLSLVFPQPDPPPKGGISGVVRADGDLNAPDNAPFARPPIWRARYNLCVQDARTREASFNQLRLTDPLVYCIAYADAFAPKYGEAVAVTVLRRTVVPPGAASGAAAGAAGPSSAPRTRMVPQTIIKQPLRPNAPPAFVQ
ncbi:hypothetical protein [Bradyrhizobium symbiodeficiens]|uniref:hypothetical protein n=1 Tax=Bradyrhizobium symbiodeficiens TaxID=1404367 RepID=UPI00140F6F10|nr:hypothetical protein [Bradyrhizobium symbiodeficiens]QIP02984.1 hypothetical protein HAU86_25765 [Bradyrhizobium symbiodeficiens]